MSFLFQKVGRGTAEIYKILKNASTTAIGPGNAVCYDYTTDANATSVILPTTAGLRFFAGVVAYGKTLAASGTDGQWGKVQIYGHHKGVKVGNGTSCYPGVGLIPVNGSGVMSVGTTHATSISTSDEAIQFVTACSAVVSSVYTDVTCFIRAM
jgi:hypothetical protein